MRKMLGCEDPKLIKSLIEKGANKFMQFGFFWNCPSAEGWLFVVANRAGGGQTDKPAGPTNNHQSSGFLFRKKQIFTS